MRGKSAFESPVHPPGAAAAQGKAPGIPMESPCAGMMAMAKRWESCGKAPRGIRSAIAGGTVPIRCEEREGCGPLGFFA